eukprot:4465774-Alexandrium_andersonii.AAC.1
MSAEQATQPAHLVALAALAGVPEETALRLWLPLATFLDNRPAASWADAPAGAEWDILVAAWLLEGADV